MGNGFCGLHPSQHRGGFIHGLLVLSLRNQIGEDYCSHLNVDYAIRLHYSADNDSDVQLSIEIEVSHRSPMESRKAGDGYRTFAG